MKELPKTFSELCSWLGQQFDDTAEAAKLISHLDELHALAEASEDPSLLDFTLVRTRIVSLGVKYNVFWLHLPLGGLKLDFYLVQDNRDHIVRIIRKADTPEPGQTRLQ